MQSGSEKRRTARLVRETPLEYTPYRVLLPRLEDISLCGTSVDVSVDERGLSFVTGYPLFTGRKLRLLIDGVARIAEVRWVATAPIGYRAGVCFSAEPPGAARG